MYISKDISRYWNTSKNTKANVIPSQASTIHKKMENSMNTQQEQEHMLCWPLYKPQTSIITSIKCGCGSRILQDGLKGKVVRNRTRPFCFRPAFFSLTLCKLCVKMCIIKPNQLLHIRTDSLRVVSDKISLNQYWDRPCVDIECSMIVHKYKCKIEKYHHPSFSLQISWTTAQYCRKSCKT